MRRKDRPFVLYSRGPLSFTIVPRGRAGWVQFAVWMALLAGLLVGFEAYLSSPAVRDNLGSVLLLFVASVIAWAVGGLWWMCAHAEVIAMSEHLRDKQRARRREQRKVDRQG